MKKDIFLKINNKDFNLGTVSLIDKQIVYIFPAVPIQDENDFFNFLFVEYNEFNNEYYATIRYIHFEPLKIKDRFTSRIIKFIYDDSLNLIDTQISEEIQIKKLSNPEFRI